MNKHTANSYQGRALPTELWERLQKIQKERKNTKPENYPIITR